MKKTLLFASGLDGRATVRIALVLAMTLTLALSGCSLLRRPAYKPDEPKPSDNQVQPTPKMRDALVYFVRGEKLGAASRPVPADKPVQVQAEELVKQLLAGPTNIEAEYGLDTTIPEGTVVLGVSIDNEVATVDLSTEYQSGGGSLSMLLRVSQVAWTITQLDGIKRVTFSIDGTPVDAIGGEGIIVNPALSREDCEGQAPAILAEQPFVNQKVKSPLVISGSANTFEAQFMVDVVDPKASF